MFKIPEFTVTLSFSDDQLHLVNEAMKNGEKEFLNVAERVAIDCGQQLDACDLRQVSILWDDLKWHLVKLNTSKTELVGQYTLKFGIIDEKKSLLFQRLIDEYFLILR